MGLAICRQVVERHGGEITAKSSPGHGPKLIVTLPIRQHKTAVKQAPSSEAEEVTLPVLASSLATISERHEPLKREPANSTSPPSTQSLG